MGTKTNHGGYEGDALPEGGDEAVGEGDGGQPGVQGEVGERGAEAEDEAAAKHGASVPNVLFNMNDNCSFEFPA